jgi:predicted nucleic acid-binding protein
MLVVDASCLVEVLTGTVRGGRIRARLAEDEEQAAPHVVDVEVFSIIRREHQRGRLDETAAAQAVTELAAWPGDRYGHQLLLDRGWQLRHTIRGWDAMYVALAEVLGATLLTIDYRLAAATGPRCRIETVPDEQP